MSCMTSLTYNDIGFGITLTEYIIDFESNMAERNYYDFSGMQTAHTSVILKSNQESELKLVLALSLFPLWRNSYINPRIMDGNQWRFIKNYNTKEYFTYGSNAYPLTYNWVMFEMGKIYK